MLEGRRSSRQKKAEEGRRMHRLIDDATATGSHKPSQRLEHPHGQAMAFLPLVLRPNGPQPNYMLATLRDVAERG